MGIFDFFFNPITQAGTQTMQKVITPPPSSPAYTGSPPTINPVIQISTPVQRPPEPTANPYQQAAGAISKTSKDIYYGAVSISEQIRRGIPEVSKRLHAVPIVGIPTAFITSRTSESFARTIEAGGMIPGGVEVLAKRPHVFPSAVSYGVGESIRSVGTELRTDPFQTVSDIAVTGVIFKGAGKARSILPTGKGRVVPRAGEKPVLSIKMFGESTSQKLSRQYGFTGQTVKPPSAPLSVKVFGESRGAMLQRKYGVPTSKTWVPKVETSIKPPISKGFIRKDFTIKEIETPVSFIRPYNEIIRPPAPKKTFISSSTPTVSLKDMLMVMPEQKIVPFRETRLRIGAVERTARRTLETPARKWKTAFEESLEARTRKRTAPKFEIGREGREGRGQRIGGIVFGGKRFANAPKSVPMFKHRDLIGNRDISRIGERVTEKQETGLIPGLMTGQLLRNLQITGQIQKQIPKLKQPEISKVREPTRKPPGFPKIRPPELKTPKLKKTITTSNIWNKRKLGRRAFGKYGETSRIRSAKEMLKGV